MRCLLIRALHAFYHFYDAAESFLQGHDEFVVGGFTVWLITVVVVAGSGALPVWLSIVAFPVAMLVAIAVSAPLFLVCHGIAALGHRLRNWAATEYPKCAAKEGRS